MGNTFIPGRLFRVARGMIQTKVILVREDRTIAKEVQKDRASESVEMMISVMARDLLTKATANEEHEQFQFEAEGITV